MKSKRMRRKPHRLPTIRDPRAAAAIATATETAGAPPIEVVSFGSKLIMGAATRALRRPAVLAVLLVLLLAVVWLSLRS